MSLAGFFVQFTSVLAEWFVGERVGDPVHRHQFVSPF